MKTIYKFLAIALVFASCGKETAKSVKEIVASNNLKEIVTKKSELNSKLAALNTEIKQLNTAIERLDTIKKNPLVTAQIIKKEIFTHFIELQGNVQTKQNVLIYPETAGILEEIFVTKGQKVTEGQALAKINDGGLKEQVAQLETTTVLAKTTFERQQRLWNQKIGSEIQFLQAKTNYEAQQNTLEQLKIQLNKATIKAPFSGIVDDIIKDKGTVVAPGMGAELFRIINLNNMYIEADIPETYISHITKGKDVEIYFPVLGEKVTSKVKQAANYINPANRTYQVEIDVPNNKNNIKPNLIAKLKINDYTNEVAMLIPQSIISENAAGDQYVYVVENLKENTGTAKQTIVKTGKTQGDVIEVLNGISIGDIVIKAGARSVKNGQEVTISSK
mgnify:CR=1 FL=1